MAWWLGSWAFTAMARVQSLVGELRSLQVAQPKSNNNNQYAIVAYLGAAHPGPQKCYLDFKMGELLVQ